jgi:hypothetical protein
MIKIICFKYLEEELNLFDQNYRNFVKPNKFFIFNYFKFRKKNNISFNITQIEYSFESNNSTIKIEYFIIFYDENNKIIPPSDISLINNMHILCNSKEINSHIKIISLADIYRNKFFKCTEFFNKNDEILLGIKIYKIENDIQIKTINFIIYKSNIYYHFITKNTFNCSQINEDYDKLYKTIYNNKSLESNLYKLKQFYLQKPICLLKKNVPLKKKIGFSLIFITIIFAFAKVHHAPLKPLTSNVNIIFI